MTMPTPPHYEIHVRELTVSAEIAGWGLYQGRRRNWETWLGRPTKDRIARYADVIEGVGSYEAQQQDVIRFAMLPDFVQATMCAEWEG